MTILYIKDIWVHNFKSLLSFELPLAKFSCLVGLNSSGKSTVLQFLDFLSQQVKGDIEGWLKSRQWQAGDLNSKITNKQTISFNVTLVHRDGFEINWIGHFNRKTLRCTHESIEWNEQLLLLVNDGSYRVAEEDTPFPS